MHLTAELFEPKPAGDAESEVVSQGIVGYYREAMIRLNRNRTGMTCLLILLLIISAGIIGPLFFPVSEDGVPYQNVPNTHYQNQAPTLGERLLVLEDNWIPPEVQIRTNFDAGVPLIPAETIAAPSGFKIVGQATVEGVTLQWEPMKGVSGYEIYRVYSGKDGVDVGKLKTDCTTAGILLARIDDPAQYTFTDSLGLNPSERYAYALLPFVFEPDTYETGRGSEAAVIETGIAKTIKLSDARSVDREAEAGMWIHGHMFLFGTDGLGRDIFARILYGTRLSLSLVFVVPTLCLLIGLLYGSILGMAGGKIDLVFMRIIEVLDAFPALLFMILLQFFFGKSMFSLVIAMSALGWTGFARIIRGEVLRLREIEFIQAARLLGASLPRIIFKHITPNLIGVMLVIWSSRMPGVIIAEAFLSLLGLGLEPPTASWGMVLNEAAGQFQSYPVQFGLTCTVVAVTILTLFLLSDAISDAFDPKLRHQG